MYGVRICTTLCETKESTLDNQIPGLQIRWQQIPSTAESAAIVRLLLQTACVFSCYCPKNRYLTAVYFNGCVFMQFPILCSALSIFLITHRQVLPILPISVSKPRKTIPLPTLYMIKCSQTMGSVSVFLDRNVCKFSPLLSSVCCCSEAGGESLPAFGGRIGSGSSHGNPGGLSRCPKKCLASILMPIR